MEPEQTFVQMWVDAQARFEEMTKTPLKRAKNLSLNDAMAELGRHFDPQDTELNGKKAQAKEWAMNLLKFIQLLGGIIAQGASVVVGPASLCFNALSFLLDIPTRISSFYDDLSALFQELSTLIQHFKIYERMDRYVDVGMELKEDTHKLMIAFVDVCAISIEFFGGSRLHTFGTLTKVALFNNKSGIESKLAEIKTLIDHQSQITGAVTLEHVLKAEHETSNSFRRLFEELNISAERSQGQLEKTQEIQDDVKTVKDVLVRDTNERNAEKKQRDEFEAICKKLSVDADVIRQSGDEIEQIQRQNLPETGFWLRKMDAYKQWSNVESGSRSQLLLSGNSGSGKSCLAFAVLDTIISDSITAGEGSMKVSVASYRFARKKQKSSDTPVRASLKSVPASSDTPVRASLKSMAAQIANTNRVFSRKLSSALKSKDFSLLKDTSPDEILKDLFNRAEDWNTTFILLFDGIDQLPDDDATQLLKAALELDAINVRIVLTGTDEKFSCCRDAKSLDQIPLINVQEHNEADIRLFIEHCLTDRKILQGNAPDVLKIVDQLRETLPDKANGNFNDIRHIIDEVSEAIESDASEEQVMQLISVKILEDSTAASMRLLDEMNHSLKVQEIEQLNELLAWVIYGVSAMTTEELTAALFIRTKRALLQSLKVKIKRKYHKILRTESNSIQVSTPDLDKIFRDSPRRKRTESDLEGNNDPRITMTININNVRQSKVRRFIWDLSESIFLDKFAFATHGTESGSFVGIGANRIDSELLIANRCFEVLLEKPTKETAALSSYSILNLITHLKSLRNSDIIDHIEPAEKSELVDNLVTLFQSSDFFGEHLDELFLFDGVGLHDGLIVIRDWLQDSVARKRLSRKALGWLKQADAEDLLYPWREIAAMIARKWLCDRSLDVLYPYKWISIFVLRQEEIKTERKAADPMTHYNVRPKPSQEGKRFSTDEVQRREIETASTSIERCSEWAVKAATIVKDSLFYERLGNTFFCFDRTDAAKEAFLKAKELPSHSWGLCKSLADVCAERGETGLAIQEMDAVFAHLRAQDELGTTEKMIFLESLVEVADWEIKLANTSKAIAKLEEAIHIDEHYYESYFKLVKIFNDAEQLPQALKILGDMHKAYDAEHKSLTKLSAMLLDYTRWLGGLQYLEQLLQVTNPHDVFNDMLFALQTALTFAKDSDRDSDAVHLHLGYGIALAHYSADETEKGLDSAISQWRESYQIGLKSEDFFVQYSAIVAAKCIFNYHFSRARMASNQSPDATAYKIHVEQMEKLAEAAFKSQYEEHPLRFSLASYYTLSQNQEKAQKLLVNDLRAGLSLLSDDHPENDFMGYSHIAKAHMYTGDDCNALSAWSLLGPSERHIKDEPNRAERPLDVNAEGKQTDADVASRSSPWPEDFFPFSCDGRCDNEFTFANSIWFCTYISNLPYLPFFYRFRNNRSSLEKNYCSKELFSEINLT